jgi:hypothetical protein
VIKFQSTAWFYKQRKISLESDSSLVVEKVQGHFSMVQSSGWGKPVHGAAGFIILALHEIMLLKGACWMWHMVLIHLIAGNHFI